MADVPAQSPARSRAGAAALALLLHLAAAFVLVRAFSPQWIGSAIDGALTAVEITVAPRPPEPAPSARQAALRAAGAAAPAGRKASPREVAAPKPKVDLARMSAPPVAGTGAQDSSGARDLGTGTGAGGAGQGTGAGGAGNGPGGGGAAARPVKIAGDINSARDYPPASRALRLGSAVTVALTVGADGRVVDCRVVRPSPDPEADRITCRLATDRFRFRPARDAAGNPVQSVYGWRQRWFAPPPR